MSERQSPEIKNAVKRPENEQESPSKMMAPPPFALNAGNKEEGGSTATPGADVGLGLDKKAGPM